MKAGDLRKGTLYLNKDHGYFIVLGQTSSYYSGEIFQRTELFFLGAVPYRMINYYRVRDELLHYEKIADLDE